MASFLKIIIDAHPKSDVVVILRHDSQYFRSIISGCNAYITVVGDGLTYSNIKGLGASYSVSNMIMDCPIDVRDKIAQCTKKYAHLDGPTYIFHDKEFREHIEKIIFLTECCSWLIESDISAGVVTAKKIKSVM
jgi:hypothetical protein